jgi:hypothetical protein
VSLNFNTTPGSNVNVFPEGTVTIPETTYGESAAFHVVSWVSVPPGTCTSAKALVKQRPTITTEQYRTPQISLAVLMVLDLS